MRFYQISRHGKIETRSGPGVLVTPEARHQGVILMHPKYSRAAARARESLVQKYLTAGCPEHEARTLVSRIPYRRSYKTTEWVRSGRLATESRGTFTEQQFADLVVQYGCCLRCGLTDVPFVPDHIVPLSRGGRHVAENVQPLCSNCNIWKGLQIIDFRIGRLEAVTRE